ncbi:MAG: signal peptidase I [Cyanobacteria bacterium J06621_8]
MIEKEENTLVELIKTLVSAAILAVGIRSCVAEARFIPSASMVPTLIEDDRLIIEKISYRFREPKRGDVVVFAPTETLKKNYNNAFIKRVIGLPGDQIEIISDVVFVNGEKLEESYIAEVQPKQKTNLPVINNHPLITVPPGQYFVLGDNRYNSLDSREWGFVPKENLIGRATVLFWPPNRLGPLDQQPLYPE